MLSRWMDLWFVINSRFLNLRMYQFHSFACFHSVSTSAEHIHTNRLYNTGISLQWRHNERDGVSNHWRLHCLLNCWFRCKVKKTSKLRVTGLCAGNSPVTGEFPTQKARNAEKFPFDDVIISLSKKYAVYDLSHYGQVTPYGEIDLGQHWLRWWPVTWWHQCRLEIIGSHPCSYQRKCARYGGEIIDNFFKKILNLPGETGLQNSWNTSI